MQKAFELFGSIALRGGDNVGRQLQNINTQAGNSNSTLSRFGATLAAIGGSIATAAAAGIAAVGTAAAVMGVKQNAALEQSEVAWTTLLGTQERAADMMKTLQDLAKTTPFEVEHVDAMAKYMHNAGLAGKALTDEILKISDVASAFAIPAHEAKEMARQMSQVRNAGIAYTEDLNILEDRGVPIMKTIAKQLGITTAEAKKMAGDGKISSEIYLNAFNAIAKGVEGASVAQSKTFNGMMAAMSDTVKMIAGELFEPLFNSLKGVMGTVQPLLENFLTTLQEGNFNFKDWLLELFPPAVVSFVQSILQEIQGFWKEHGEAIRGAIENLKTLLGPVFKVIFAGAVLFVKMAWEAIKGIITGLVTFIKGVTLLLTGILTGDFGRMWEGVKAIFVGAVKMIWNYFNLLFIGRIVGGIRMLAVSIGGRISAMWASIVQFFKSGNNRVISIFSSLRQAASRIFAGVRNAITSPIQSARDTVLKIIESIRNAFNNLKLKIPKFKLPKISVDMIKNKFGIPVPDFNVDWQAKGGIFNSPRIVGLAEAGAEAVIPLQNRKYMAPFSQAIAENLAQLQAVSGLNGRIVVPVYLNGREMARAVVNDIDQQLARKQQNNYMR